MAPAQHPWAVVVPVKLLALAKSRVALPPADRQRLALAMAEDTIRACLEATAVARVVVVTDDPLAQRAATRLGAVVVADVPNAGLNPALRHGARHATGLVAGIHLATVSSDLPALRGSDLDGVLLRAEHEPLAVVADAGGSGTVLLAAGSLADFTPAFGPASYDAHRAGGAVDLTAAAAPALRRDVDTVDDLRAALALGAGAVTRRVSGQLGIRTADVG
jgi:2-phospho-L-lactate/phosphoenolpyruvate guanylyltransferase